MSGKYSVICAYTAQPNTAMTDAMLEVPHVVKYMEMGVKKEATIYAECPMDATNKVRERLRKKYITEKTL
tara:strand:+ start:230 stop:439 length:210 start_codon:yes stop_codon:yes gene_type:complete